jgi:hypothetical protein
MGFHRLTTGVLVFLLALSVGFGQSLTEAARKEKERRAAYKNKPIALLTNEGLSKLNKKEAMSTSSSPEAAPEAEAPSEPSETEAGRTESADSSRIIVPRISTPRLTPVVSSGVNSSSAGSADDPEARWQKAKEYADLLELKLNALWQEFYSMDDMTSRDKIQQEISATFEKYTRAREEEAQALAQVEKPKTVRD